MSYQYISLEREDHLCIVTINRPDVMNALNAQTHAEMAQAFDEFEQDAELWVAIVTGAGDTAFCAGGDISAMVDAKTEDDYKVPESGYGGLTNRFSCNKPIIAAVNGLALGGGFEIALSSDIVIASETASFGLPEPKIGTAAVASGMHRLVRDIGLKPAMAILLTAEFVSAQKALSLGLVNEVVAPDQVMTVARDYARRILKCAPLAIQATKQGALRGLQYADVEQAMQAQADKKFDAVETMMASEDIREGLQAFMDKRKPQWKAR
jgi:enoyl-CoA hydratase/carnithine racemase